MDSIQKHQQRAQDKQDWAACDPVTLVSAGREALSEVQQGKTSPELANVLEEITNRFDSQTRAALGASPYAFSGGPQPR